MSETQAMHPSDIRQYPFLAKVLITFTKLNAQGTEEKHKDEVIFKLDRPSARMPWYVLRNYSVPNFLKSRYGQMEVGWQRIYEIKTIKLINREDPNDITDIPLRVMTLSQLELYCQKWDLNVPVHEFYSVEKAREFVALRQDDEKGYKHILAEYREGKKRAYPELDAVRSGKVAQTGEVSEFDTLDTAPKPEIGKASPSRVAGAGEKMPGDKPALEPGEKAVGLPSTGDVPSAIDPFAGV